jgi:hypothetical protein
MGPSERPFTTLGSAEIEVEYKILYNYPGLSAALYLLLPVNLSKSLYGFERIKHAPFFAAEHFLGPALIYCPAYVDGFSIDPQTGDLVSTDDYLSYRKLYLGRIEGRTWAEVDGGIALIQKSITDAFAVNEEYQNWLKQAISEQPKNKTIKL